MEEEYEKFSFTVEMVSQKQKIKLSSSEKEWTVKENRAVALVADKFYQGAFLPATELEKSYKGWENTLHDLNHQGTTDARGLMVSSNILYFIGYNDNVQYDSETKRMSMDVHVVNDTHYASAWKGYMELCEKSGQTPNVSVSFQAKTKAVKVSDLPEGVDYEAYGLDKEDSVMYIYDIQADALSTVFKGACSDKDGCGIGACQNQAEVQSEDGDDTTNEKERLRKEEIISWLKKHDK